MKDCKKMVTKILCLTTNIELSLISAILLPKPFMIINLIILEYILSSKNFICFDVMNGTEQ